jgi:hypothetical protein
MKPRQAFRGCLDTVLEPRYHPVDRDGREAGASLEQRWRTLVEDERRRVRWTLPPGGYPITTAQAGAYGGGATP